MDDENALDKIEELLNTLPEFQYASGRGSSLYIWTKKDFPLLVEDHRPIRSVRIDYRINGTYSMTGVYLTYTGSSFVWINDIGMTVKFFFDLEDNITRYIKMCLSPVVKLGWK